MNSCRAPARCRATTRNRGDRGARAHAFTLIELLVVISIIAILIAILLPALARGRIISKRTSCGSNLHSIGVALQGYLNDFKGVFPVHSNWGNLVGRHGIKNTYDEAPGTGWENETSTSGQALKVRPLNKYLDSPMVARCPDDRGDVLQNNVSNCFEAYGTSYLVHWRSDNFATAHATSDNIGSKPLRESDGRGPMSLKLVMAEWVWHGNRALSQPQNLWHNIRAIRQYNILYGDSHVKFFSFPRDIENWYDPNAAAPDPNRGWW